MSSHSQYLSFEGIDVQIFRSQLDGELCIQIETHDLFEAEGEESACNVRVYYNDAVATAWDGEGG